jgi:mannosyltransferase
MATTPWAEFWPVLRYVDAVLAPYYVLMHAWVSVFGDSDVAVRAPSVIAMAASAGLIGAIGNRLAGRRAGLLAGVVFAVLPSTSRFGAEARPYALTVLAACLATWFLIRARENPRAHRWVLYAAAVAVLGWLHVVALLLLAAHAWSVLAWRRPVWWRFGLAAAAGALTSLPLLVYGHDQRHQVAYIPAVSLDTAHSYGDVLFGGVALALAILALSLFSLPLRFPSAVFAAWAVVPAAALVAVSVVVPMFLPRYLVYTTPGWALMAGVTLARLRPLWMVTALAVLAALALPAQADMRSAGGHQRQATSQLATVLTGHSRPGDGVVYADDEPVGAWTARDTVAHYVPSGARPADVLATHPPRTAGLLLATECQDVAACLGDTPRLWLVRIGTLTDPLAGMGRAKEEALRRDYAVHQIWYPTGLTLALLERRSTG